jgi:hypothetical protein
MAPRPEVTEESPRVKIVLGFLIGACLGFTGAIFTTAVIEDSQEGFIERRFACSSLEVMHEDGSCSTPEEAYVASLPEAPPAKPVTPTTTEVPTE